MDIIKSNKLIAEFMGMYIRQNGEGTPYMYDHPYKAESIHPHCLEFNSNWKWVMPIVEKIESIKRNNETDGYISKYTFSWRNYITIQSCWVELSTTGEYIVEADGNTKIEATYNAVVQYIVWYNKNK